MFHRDAVPRQTATRHGESCRTHPNACFCMGCTTDGDHRSIQVPVAPFPHTPPSDTFRASQKAYLMAASSGRSAYIPNQSYEVRRYSQFTSLPYTHNWYHNPEHESAGSRDGFGQAMPVAAGIMNSIPVTPPRTAGFGPLHYRGVGRLRHLNQVPNFSQNVPELDLQIPGVLNGQLSPSFWAFRGSEFFQIGVVFKTPWSEPAGNSNQPGRVVTNLIGEPVFSKIQWFMVVGKGHNYCICVSINTYGGRGAAGRRERHSIVYTDLDIPPLTEYERLDGHVPLGEAIRIEPNILGMTMVKESRINYDKFYTVENSAKTWIFGRVHPDDMLKFKAQLLPPWMTHGHEQLPLEADRIAQNPPNPTFAVASAMRFTPACESSAGLSATVPTNQYGAWKGPARTLSPTIPQDTRRDGDLSGLFVDPADLNVGVQSTLLHSASDDTSGSPTNEQQAGPIAHERLETAAMNWRLSRRAVNALQKELEEAEGYEASDNDVPYLQHKKRRPHE